MRGKRKTGEFSGLSGLSALAALYVLVAPTASVALYASTDLLALQAVLFRAVQDAFICKTKNGGDFNGEGVAVYTALRFE